MQQITLEGNRGRDPYFGQGTRTRSAHFNVATNPAEPGQRTPAPLWIPIVVFGDEPVRTVESRVRKGTRVRIHGILQTNPQRGGDRLVAREIEVIARPRIVPTVRTATPEEMAPTPAPESTGRSRTPAQAIRGYERWQRCGPGGSLRKQIWIAPRERGPDGRMHVVRA